MCAGWGGGWRKHVDVFSSLVLYLWIMQTKSPIIRNIFYPFKLNIIRIFTPTNNDSTIQTVAGPSSLFLQLPHMQLPKPAESTEASPGVGRSRTRRAERPVLLRELCLSDSRQDSNPTDSRGLLSQITHS